MKCKIAAFYSFTVSFVLSKATLPPADPFTYEDLNESELLKMCYIVS